MEPPIGSTQEDREQLIAPALPHKDIIFSNENVANHSLVASLDSGYGSYNATPYNTPNISSNSSINVTPHRLINTTNLITIPEAPDNTKLTPVTQNIRKITEFHITTPKSQDFPLIGTKRSAVAAINFEDFQSTPKKARIEPRGENSSLKHKDSTPYRSKKLRNKKRSFRQKLRSAPDFNTCFDENIDVENTFSSRRSELSPQSKRYGIEKRTPLSNANVNFIKSSTPKSCDYVSKLTNISKDKSLSVKKLLSFSDEQFESLVNSGPKADGFTSKEIDNGSVEKNELATKLGVTDISVTIPEASDTSGPSTTDIYQEESFQEYKQLYPLINSVFKDKQFTKQDVAQGKCSDLSKESFKEDIDIPFNEEDTEYESPKKVPKLQGFQEILQIESPNNHMEISSVETINPSKFEQSPQEVGHNYNLRTDLDVQLNETIECETPKQSPKRYSGKRDSSEEKDRLLRTPKKSKFPSADHERLGILYPTVPRTPSKRQCGTQVGFKRKLDGTKCSDHRPRKYYDGATYLNIISKLESYTLVLERVFELLSSQDLVNLTRVSKSWRRIVRSIPKANMRLVSYLEEWKRTKENDGCRNRFPPTRKGSIPGSKKITDPSRTPFSQSNFKSDRKRSLDVQKSPPVSPSKRKFHENQKVVRTLAENEKLTKCPRCAKSSRIINPLGDKQNHHNNSSSTIVTSSNNPFALPKAIDEQTFQATSTFHSLLSNNNNDNLFAGTSLSQPIATTTTTGLDTTTIYRGKLVRSMSVESTLFSVPRGRRASSPFKPYGECSGLSCKFRFCLDCLCEYHPGVRCKLTEPISPSKDDLQNGILQLSSVPSSRSLKSRRKSLKRLCF